MGRQRFADGAGRASGVASMPIDFGGERGLEPPLIRLASLVPEEEYIHRAPYSAAEAFGLHDLYHA